MVGIGKRRRALENELIGRHVRALVGCGDWLVVVGKRLGDLVCNGWLVVGCVVGVGMSVLVGLARRRGTGTSSIAVSAIVLSGCGRDFT